MLTYISFKISKSKVRPTSDVEADPGAAERHL